MEQAFILSICGLMGLAAAVLSMAAFSNGDRAFAIGFLFHSVVFAVLGWNGLP